jgi:uncharacterized protein YjiK
LLAASLTIGCMDPGSNNQAKAAEGGRNKKKEKKYDKKEKLVASPEIRIEQVWELPHELREVSGIAYLDKDRFACIQDEDGKIYIYNIASQKIERVISFGDPGDYEEITLAGNTAYVVRSDGMLFEVADIRSANSSVRSYQTPLTEEQNIEGLCYDKGTDRLLLAVKNNDLRSDAYKGIYEFNLRSKKLNTTPVFKINLQDEMLQVNTGRKKAKEVMPSSIMRHPVGSDLYILDGPSAGLIIMDRSGRLTHRYTLGSDFAKPEGITFSPAGEMFVSNEGKKQAANIIRVRLVN